MAIEKMSVGTGPFVGSPKAPATPTPAGAASVAAQPTAVKDANLDAHAKRVGESSMWDWGPMPWEKAGLRAAAALGVVAAGASGIVSAASNDVVTLAKDALSANKKLNEIKESLSKLEIIEAKGGPSAPKGLSALDKVSTGFKLVGGLKSALSLKNTIAAVKDGATFMELNNLASDLMGTARFVSEGVKLATKGATQLIGKGLGKVLGVAGAATDAVRRVDKLSHWDELSTKDKIANLAYLAGDAADVVAAVAPLPPVKFAAAALGAGMALIGMGAEHFDEVAQVASAVGEKVSNLI